MAYPDSAPGQSSYDLSSYYDAAPHPYSPYGSVQIEATGDYVWIEERDASTGQSHPVLTSAIEIVYPEMACRVSAELRVGTMVSAPDGQSRPGAVIVHENRSQSPLPDALGRQLVASMPINVDPDTPEGRQARAGYILAETDALYDAGPFYATHYAHHDWQHTDQLLTTPPPTTRSPSYITAD